MLRVTVVFALAGAVSGALASPPAKTPEAVQAAVAKLNPSLQIHEPHSSPVDGLSQTSLDGTSGYVTADGRYFIVGDMRCAKDRHDAMSRATRGEAIQKPADCSAPSVANQYALGQTLGIQGTPMIVLEDGNIIGGYMPASQLAKQLDGDVVEKSVAR